ncbi:hypothetical protein GXW83_10255 [Streptacidiphilus sp. PB12-B1b]|uniref:sirohydrochlorin chelatase n=1 Tax=Streptacidiphilus sp. PB12-B1b TaxID=2705012 RepID=UPI0015F8B5EF|nr:hypothetical protein [Streptacidiphilus sp. PB12-B1b]QMU76060.1 hypothetical protein GXW83_10255 [Streptacidiphilus sp. PB12-B1b]
MSSAATPSTPLPVRTPGSRARGRHRRPERPEIPAGAPALLLAVPSEATAAAQQIADELVSLVRAEQPGIDATAVYLAAETVLTGDDAPAEGQEALSEGETAPTLAAVLARDAEKRAAGSEIAAPVVVPLLPGASAALQSVLASLEGEFTVTDALGPHPLLAEALHVRLSEAGLARADRARLFAVNTSADGVVLATVGGEEALQHAGITGVLLAARLAVPVVAASLDQPGSVAAAVAELRGAGCAQPALAPYLVGPEVEADLLKSVAAEVDCPAAEPLGAYPTIARLALGLYLGALGIARDAELG